MKWKFTLIATLWVNSAFALDYTNHPQVCKAMSDHANVTMSQKDFRTCLCRLSTIEQELGEGFVKIMVQISVEGKPISEATDLYTEETFIQEMEPVHPKLAICIE